MYISNLILRGLSSGLAQLGTIYKHARARTMTGGAKPEADSIQYPIGSKRKGRVEWPRFGVVINFKSCGVVTLMGCWVAELGTFRHNKKGNSTPPISGFQLGDIRKKLLMSSPSFREYPSAPREILGIT